MPIRIATFNCENLFARYRFRQNVSPNADGFTRNELAFDINDDDEKKITGKAVAEANADVIALQEVDNLEVLDRFVSRYLPTKGYKHRLLIDSHDPRFIDVALLSRFPLSGVTTHRDERNAANTTWLFSRDCLEVTVTVPGAGAAKAKTLRLYVNHLKSMMDPGSSNGRASTKARRVEQSKRVAAIVDAEWKPMNHSGNFVVLGDLNDFVDDKTGINALVKHPKLVNVLTRAPKAEQWTHYWAGGGEYRQLDYLLVSKALADANPGTVPGVVRKGLPHRATKYTGERFPDVGENDPKASDHCPLYWDCDLI